MPRWLIPLLCALLAAAGCWDTQDIQDRAFVTAIALDSGEDDTYKVTLEIIRPMGLRPYFQGPPSVTKTTQAESILGALQQLQARASRPISLSHLRIVLVGEALARESFMDIVNYFQGHPEVQMRLELALVQDGEAYDLLHAEPVLEKYMSAELVAMKEVNPFLSLVRTNPFFQFVHDLRSSQGRGLATRVFTAADTEQAIRHGSAVFHDWTLVGWLSHEETQWANWLGDAGTAVVEGRQGESTYSYLVTYQSVRVIPRRPNDRVEFAVQVRTQGSIRQQQGAFLDLSLPDHINKLERLLSLTITEQVERAIHQAQQEFGVDYLGFGTRLYQRAPRVYQSMDWDKEFPQIPISVEVDARITSSGISY